MTHPGDQLADDVGEAERPLLPAQGCLLLLPLQLLPLINIPPLLIFANTVNLEKE